jgi:hypothetical protein
MIKLTSRLPEARLIRRSQIEDAPPPYNPRPSTASTEKLASNRASAILITSPRVSMVHVPTHAALHGSRNPTDIRNSTPFDYRHPTQDFGRQPPRTPSQDYRSSLAPTHYSLASYNGSNLNAALPSAPGQSGPKRSGSVTTRSSMYSGPMPEAQLPSIPSAFSQQNSNAAYYSRGSEAQPGPSTSHASRPSYGTSRQGMVGEDSWVTLPTEPSAVHWGR